MKQKLLLFFVALLTTATASAYNFEVNGIYYNYTDSGVGVTYKDIDFNSYSGEVVIPSEVTYNNITYTVTSIGYSAFRSCSGLISITIPESVTSIGDYAFQFCSGLISITIPESVTSIGHYAFYGCNSLTSVNISDLDAWLKISFEGSESNPLSYAHNLFLNGELVTELTIPNSVTTINKYAFHGCASLTSITIPDSVTSICDYAFYGCSGLTSINIGNSVTSIGVGAFNEIKGTIRFRSLTPIACKFSEGNIIIVPDEALQAYKEAWSDYASMILSDRIPTSYSVEVEARDNSSDVMDQVNNAAGEFDAMLYVVSLKVKGTINSYDIMTMRNKMKNLRYLDLSDASVVANTYEYYSGCHTYDDILGDYAFSDLKFLLEVRLPNSITSIGENTFVSCANLKKVYFGENLKAIGSYAFSECRNIESIELPTHLQSIDNYTFERCYSLRNIVFSPELTFIGSYAFFSCNRLTSIMLPPSLKSIGNGAFYGCTDIQEVRIPESIESIGNDAFGSANIKDIYTWTIQPTNISQNTFDASAFTQATLHVPETAKKLYYWDTQWSQFLNIVQFNEPYTYFYLSDKDLEIDEDTARLDGEPDADIRNNGGLIVAGDESQDLGNVTLSSNGDSTAASVIGGESQSQESGANINIDNLKIQIDINGGRWYFFAFPFDVPFAGIKFPGQFVWRYYDGEYRAAEGSGAWKNASGSLIAGRGYIFQASKSGKLELNVGRVSIGGDDKVLALESHASANAADASWNLVGNPYTSYYELADLGYNAPITIWNGSTYEAYNPMDDDLTLYPFQAFFVQKPQNVDGVTFNADARETKNQSVDPNHRKDARNRRMARANSVATRHLIDLRVEDANGTTDKTRVVFNENSTSGYDIECDASKFISTDAPQLYSIDNTNVIYAINERPEGDGIVRLGFRAQHSGTFTIKATRMDVNMDIVDMKTGSRCALDEDDYTFTAQEGIDDDRFILCKTREASGIDEIEGNDADANVIYVGTNGVIYGDKNVPHGVAIRVNNGKASKTVIK